MDLIFELQAMANNLNGCCKFRQGDPEGSCHVQAPPKDLSNLF